MPHADPRRRFPLLSSRQHSSRYSQRSGSDSQKGGFDSWTHRRWKDCHTGWPTTYDGIYGHRAIDESAGEEQAGTRTLARRSAGSRNRNQRRPGPGEEGVDLRHRHPHSQVGRLGEAHHSRPHGDRPRIHGRDRRGGVERARFLPRPAGERRRATWSAAAAATASRDAVIFARVPAAWA